MSRFRLQQDEILSIQELLKQIVGEIETVEDPGFQARAMVHAHDLPRRVRQALHEFKLNEPEDGLFLLSGFPVDQERLGRTPAHWKDRSTRSPALAEEVLLVLLGSLLGDCIAWSTQQDGLIVHDILPIKEHEKEQLGSGSEQPLRWHTEDAFHPYRGDYLGMLCLRNPDAVPTTHASFESLPLDPGLIDLLFEPHYTIRPDESHQPKNRAILDAGDADVAARYEQIERMNRRPEKIPVLFGDRRSPYVRLDPYFMDPVEDNPRAQEALDTLIREIDRRLEEVPLATGDICFIDNFKAVHGRKPFKARFDGSDRWLKRINITRDLRKSRAARAAASSRVIQ